MTLRIGLGAPVVSVLDLLSLLAALPGRSTTNRYD
jgi:hypothetical protein